MNVIGKEYLLFKENVHNFINPYQEIVIFRLPKTKGWNCLSTAKFSIIYPSVCMKSTLEP